MRKCSWCGRTYNECGVQTPGVDHYRFCSMRCQTAYKNNEKREKAAYKARVNERRKKIKELNNKLFHKDSSPVYTEEYSSAESNLNIYESPCDSANENLIEELEFNTRENLESKSISADQFDGEGINFEAIISGLVLRLNVQVGELVRKDQVLMVMEAMKMECEIYSPCDGIIVSIMVSPGQTIKRGEPILVIKGTKEEERTINENQFDNTNDDSDCMIYADDFSEPRKNSFVSILKSVVVFLFNAIFFILKYIGIGIYYLVYYTLRIIWTILAFIFIHPKSIPLILFLGVIIYSILMKS